MAWLMAALMVLALPAIAAAQAGGVRVSGVVTDETSAVVPGVAVTLTGEGGQVTSTVTDAQGRYVFENVAPGSYELSFELAGLAKQTRKVVVAAEPVNLETTLAVSGVEEVVQVTGTLIPRPALEGMSPVTALDVEAIQYRGLNRVEDLLTSLPQVFAAQNSTIANGASGTATVDLRDLGTDRTLVLIDGRRMSAGDAFETAPDLNFIPSALVKRVDVLTGGASSVYGADAVAGVVNFVLDRDFQGVRGGVQWGAFQHNNRNDVAASMNKAKAFEYPAGSTWNRAPASFNVALGGRFADRRGHAAAYLDYRDTPAITKDARDYTNCSPGLGSAGPSCSGSSTWQDGRFIVVSADGESDADYVLDRNSPGGNQLRPRTANDVYNYAPANFMQRPDKKWTAGGFLTYEWNRRATGYAEVMLMDDYTDAQIAPSGNFFSTSELNCDNPMLSAQQRKLLCTDMGYGPDDIATVIIGRRNVEGGGRIAQISHTALRYSFGMKGEINNLWTYDIYGLQAEMHSPQSYANDFNSQRIQDALIVDGDAGNPASWECRSGNEGCVPWNIFTMGGVTQGALDYLQLPLILDSGTRTRVVSGTLTADFKDYGVVFPSAVEGISVAFGGQYRHEKLFLNPDLAYRLGIGAGQGGPIGPVEGDYDVNEFFAEGLVPLVQEAPGFKDLSLELGYRYSDYSSTGGWPTYKFMGSWSPVNDLKLRGGFNRATRSPNVNELFTPQQLGLGGSEDICAGSSPSATQAQCELLGVPTSFYGRVLSNPADQYNTWGGGNPRLNPEVADTFTVGLVITPQKLPGFTAALDFYNIKIEDTIGSFGPEDIQNQCAATGNPTLCGLIHRDRFYTLWLTPDAYTITTNVNIGKREAQGLDVNANYSFSAGGAGSFTVSLMGSYLQNSKIDTGLFAYDCVGYFGNQCGIPKPNWRHFARVTWQPGFNTSISAGWRMVGPVTNDDGSPNDAIGEPSNIALLEQNDVYKFDAYHYLDLAVSYQLVKNYRLMFGVNNVFDKEPPLAPGMSDNDYGPGYYGTYDHLGRYVFSGIQFTF
ncbi:MAG TPA: TonB-dependent receptor [Vicinamibacterales bacterium]|nr:TonB-dependent receptor [Vicinamibacterales bacterium]